MKIKRNLSILVAIAGNFLVNNLAVEAQTFIDFETTPNGERPLDNSPLAIDDPYIAEGVSLFFGFDVDGDGVTETPVSFERSRDDSSEEILPNGWRNDRRFPNATPFDLADTAALGQQLGDWYLNGGEIPDNWQRFIINYQSNNLVTATTGELWDIDVQGGTNRNERFRVDAFDLDGNLFASSLSPNGNNFVLDARPWVYSFENEQGISQIQIDYVGNRTNDPLHFNNLSLIIEETEAQEEPTVPEPSSLLSMGLLAGMGAFSKRFYLSRRNRNSLDNHS